MTLFDRRLLAYFNDGLGSGNPLLSDRMADYQRDLAEIERELSKYQLLLGDRQVQFKHRNRDEWIVRNREQKTVKERYTKIVQELLEGQDVTEHRRDHIDRKRPSLAARRKSRMSLAHRPSVREKQSSAPALWVQICAVHGVPAPRFQKYVVRVAWLGRANFQQTEEKTASFDESGTDICIFREQVKLDWQTGAGKLVVTVHGRGNDSADSQIGEILLDANVPENYQAQKHPLRDKYARPVAGMAIHLSLARGEPATSAASRVEPASSAFVMGPRTEPPVVEPAAVSLERPFQEPSALDSENTSIRTALRQDAPIMVVTQDPAALDISRINSKESRRTSKEGDSTTAPARGSKGQEDLQDIGAASATEPDDDQGGYEAIEEEEEEVDPDAGDMEEEMEEEGEEEGVEEEDGEGEEDA